MINNIKKICFVRKFNRSIVYECCEFKKEFIERYLVFNENNYRFDFPNENIEYDNQLVVLDNYLTKINIKKDLDKQEIYGTVKKMRRI